MRALLSEYHASDSRLEQAELEVEVAVAEAIEVAQVGLEILAHGVASAEVELDVLTVELQIGGGLQDQREPRLFVFLHEVDVGAVLRADHELGDQLRVTDTDVVARLREDRQRSRRQAEREAADERLTPIAAPNHLNRHLEYLEVTTQTRTRLRGVLPQPH
jgi:hypothetical protein